MSKDEDKDRGGPVWPPAQPGEAGCREGRTAGSLEGLSRSIIDSIADGYYEVDFRGNFTFISNYFEQLGYTRDELMGMSFAHLVGVEDRQRILAAYGNVFRTGRSLKNFEFPLIAKNGERKLVSVSAAPIEDTPGIRSGFRGIFQDVTALREGENLLLEISRTSPIGVYALKDGRFTYVNRVFQQLAGFTEDELLGRESRTLVSPEDWPLVWERAVNMLKGGETCPYEFKLIGRNGKIRRVMESLYSLQRGEEKLVIGHVMDLTALRQVEMALRQSEERYRTIIENITEGYYELDREGRLVFFNDALASIFSLDREKLINLDCRRITAVENMEEFQDKFRLVWETGQPNPGVEWEIRRDDGKIIYAEISISLRRDDAGRPVGFRGILRDMTDRHNREALIRQMAYFDPVTELPNRRLFEDRFQLALAGAARWKKKLALLLMDLDRFKEVNDTYGHEAGDRVLKEVGQRLGGLLRKGDTVARLGGDEFVVLLTDINHTRDALNVAEKILREIERPVTIEGRPERVSVSIGISLYPRHDLDKSRLLNFADQAMYWAKKSGSCFKVYSASMARKKPMAPPKGPSG